MLHASTNKTPIGASGPYLGYIGRNYVRLVYVSTGESKNTVNSENHLYKK